LIHQLPSLGENKSISEWMDITYALGIFYFLFFGVDDGWLLGFFAYVSLKISQVGLNLDITMVT
jgi:hypothetical protein